MQLKPEVLEGLHPSLLGAIQRDRPERPVVMVTAAAAKLHLLAVELEPHLPVPHERADPERLRHRVDGLAGDEHLNPSAV